MAREIFILQYRFTDMILLVLCKGDCFETKETRSSRSERLLRALVWIFCNIRPGAVQLLPIPTSIFKDVEEVKSDE